MKEYKFEKYDLLLSYNPCDIFYHFNVSEMHGLNLNDCIKHENSRDSAYIAGWFNISPIDGKPFVFINLTRCVDDIRTTGLIMHEMSHLYWDLNYDNLKNKEEEIITNAEEETYKIINIIKSIL